MFFRKKKPVFVLDIDVIKTPKGFEGRNAISVKDTNYNNKSAILFESDTLSLTSKDEKYIVTLEVIGIKIKEYTNLDN